ncbi:MULTISPECIES: VC2046/SO_2500 family protein [unclassified Pseudoalteromonas]|uniref:VC2046/SO_2500 family protein n=1 Tax=unclassified Pseudoalteromonas TaxID=194690 RepID=UPI002097BCEE|nr:VC2046/SO_2500 family protein [Pseudoalteromonas sp. XMcav2-N]MCO7188350.1 queD like 2 [Pseudoalteromonas sp. XMcav2-N]
MQIDGILCKEAQLGSALNHSVHEARRGDFALLLSLLSQDALDFSQFDLPHTSPEQPDKSEAALKLALQLGPQKPLAPEHFNMLIGQDNGFLVQEGDLASLRLKECLQPEPYAVRNDKKHIPLHIVDNLEPAVRQRLEKTRNPHMIVDNKDIDAAGFYDQIAGGEMQSMLQVAV